MQNDVFTCKNVLSPVYKGQCWVSFDSSNIPSSARISTLDSDHCTLMYKMLKMIHVSWKPENRLYHCYSFTCFAVIKVPCLFLFHICKMFKEDIIYFIQGFIAASLLVPLLKMEGQAPLFQLFAQIYIRKVLPLLCVNKDMMFVKVMLCSGPWICITVLSDR